MNDTGFICKKCNRAMIFHGGCDGAKAQFELTDARAEIEMLNLTVKGLMKLLDGEKMKILLCKNCESRLIVVELEQKGGELNHFLYCPTCKSPPKDFNLETEQ